MRASLWSEIEFCQSSQQAVSDSKSGVNCVLQRRVVSTQWDSRARSPECQHRRYIGCEKLTCFLSLACWLIFFASASLAVAYFRTAQIAVSRCLNSQPTPIDTRKVSRFVDTSGERLKQTNYRKLAGGAEPGKQWLCSPTASQFGLRYCQRISCMAGRCGSVAHQ